MSVLGSFLNAANTLTDDAIHGTQEKGSPLYAAAETILKGLEIELPDGAWFMDKGGKRRREARIRWWDRKALTIRAAAITDGIDPDMLPNKPLPSEAIVPYDDTKPVFFGHYWLRGTPELTSDTRACLDFSIAQDGYLCAYRWEGEERLRSENLYWVR